MPVEERTNNQNIVLKEINKIIRDKFEYGQFVYLYYSFLDDFHSEPKDWQDLFERGNYKEVLSDIQQRINDYNRKE